MTYQCPVLHFKTCDGQHERNGQPHSAMDESITGHKLHCPDCDKHLTSLLLCLGCNKRYTVVLDVELLKAQVYHFIESYDAWASQDEAFLGGPLFEAMEQARKAIGPGSL